jgi:hypothetical protein
MVLDPHGRPLARRLGFVGGFAPEKREGKPPQVALIGFTVRREDESTDEPIEQPTDPE